ncbi:MAG: hypothetical protein ABIS47_03430 [Acidimicrobiales bacterium]
MLHIDLSAGVIRLSDTATGLVLAEPAAVAIDRRSGLPFLAGWAALAHDRVTWPLERLAQADVDRDPEPRRCLLAHLVRGALDRRPWWDRILCPQVTLVVPAWLSPSAVEVVRRDASFAGAAKNVRVERRRDAWRDARPLAAD